MKYFIKSKLLVLSRISNDIELTLETKRGQTRILFTRFDSAGIWTIPPEYTGESMEKARCQENLPASVRYFIKEHQIIHTGIKI